MEQFCSNFHVWVQIRQPYTLCKWKKNRWEEFLDKTLLFAIGFEPLNDGAILAP